MTEREGTAAERERVEQKDQKIGEYEEDGSEAFDASRCRLLHLPIFPIFLFALPLPVAEAWSRGASLVTSETENLPRRGRA
jgi:hypothetical protein